MTGDDKELLEIAKEFAVIDALLDDCVAAESRPDVPRLLDLHREWLDACLRAAQLSSSTPQGQRAKASILISILEVCAPANPECQPHELLAASLARDLLAGGCAPARAHSLDHTVSP